MGEKRRAAHRRRPSWEDDDDDAGGISGWKLGMVIGVIVVCFAMLYPSLFHPMLMSYLGRGPPQTPSINQQRPPMHPAMGGAGAHPRHPGGPGGRPDIHPAMRMAQAQAEASSPLGGGKGMFTWMLPIYTVGVVVFLLYTLFKSKTKKKSRKNRRHQYDSEIDSELDDSDDDEEVKTNYGAKFGKKKLAGLQKKLRQTEEAMSKILEQLETVQNGGTPIDLDAAEELAEQLENETKEKEEIENDKLNINLTNANEQYINDLEKALMQFKSLSKEYDKAKKQKMKKHVETSEEEDEEEDEEEEEEIPEPEPVKKKSKKKIKKEESEVEEEGFDVDSAIKKEENSKVRRRRAKKT